MHLNLHPDQLHLLNQMHINLCPDNFLNQVDIKLNGNGECSMFMKLEYGDNPTDGKKLRIC